VLQPDDDAVNALSTENALGDRLKRFGPLSAGPCLGEFAVPERGGFFSPPVDRGSTIRRIDEDATIIRLIGPREINRLRADCAAALKKGPLARTSGPPASRQACGND
jgi:hypothetical protein